MPAKPRRFVETESQVDRGTFLGGKVKYTVVMDKKTGEEYIILFQSGVARAMCRLR
jgi:hypothetical protein